MHLLLPIPFSIIACYTDIKTGKIKNYITYPLILLGIFFNCLNNDFQGFTRSLLGIFAVFLVTSLIPVFKLGGGDLKLAMGYAAFLKYEKMLTFFFFFILFTVIGNIVCFICKEGFRSFLSELKQEVKTLGLYKTQFNKIVGAPFLLGAYIITILMCLL